MRSRRRLAPCLSLLALGLPAAADEGRIPIYKPTVITQPGSYVVTRDFSGSQPIVVQASDVAIDLGGHVVSGTAFPVIDIAEGVTHTTIRNGTLSGAIVAIRQLAPGSTVTPDVLVEDVLIQSIGGHGIHVLGIIPRLEVRRCRARSVTGDAVRGETNIGSGRLVVHDCNFSSVRRAIFADISTPLDARRNVVDGYGNGAITAAITASAIGGVIEGNVVANGGSDDVGISVAGSTQVRVAGNNVSNAGSHGIYVMGAFCLVEGNQVTMSGGCGISFSNATGSAYRQNLLRNNTGGAVCGTATDAGGNIL